VCGGLFVVQRCVGGGREVEGDWRDENRGEEREDGEWEGVSVGDREGVREEGQVSAALLKRRRRARNSFLLFLVALHPRSKFFLVFSGKTTVDNRVSRKQSYVSLCRWPSRIVG
jgi:hypothetical protein